VTTNFYYDGNGARVRKEVLGESTTFYAGSLYEVKDGAATKYIFGADRRIAKITDGEGVQYFSKDHLGSSTVVTDDSGAVVEQADYRPFGEDRFYTGTVAAPTPYKYTDQELDASTGLYNYDARHYDPAIGRFISPDSLIPDQFDPQQLNPYAYCSNNPLIYVDPTGHDGGLTAGLLAGLAMALGAYANHTENFDDYQNGKMTGAEYGGSLARGAAFGGIVATQPEIGVVEAVGLGMINNAANQTDKGEPLDSPDSVNEQLTTVVTTVGATAVAQGVKEAVSPPKTKIGTIEPVPFSNPQAPKFEATVERVAQDGDKAAKAGYFANLAGKIAKSYLGKKIRGWFSNDEGEDDPLSLDESNQNSINNSQNGTNSSSGEDAHDGTGSSSNSGNGNEEPTP
jgi:RHS repeat-associated protein